MSGRSKPVCPECGGRQSVFAAHQASGTSCPLPEGACDRTASGECPMMR